MLLKRVDFNWSHLLMLCLLLYIETINDFTQIVELVSFLVLSFNFDFFIWVPRAYSRGGNSC